MAEAVHLVETINSAVSMNSTSFATRMTLSAAELGSAGFANSDEALVLLFAIMRQANTATEQVYRVTYNGSVLTSSVASPRIDSWATSTNTGRNIGFMGRVDLATLADLDFDNQRQGTSANVFVDRATLAAIRLSDFGTENTDWFWNKSTTDVAHTTTYSGTSRAEITFTPDNAGEDWVVFSYAHFAVDSASVNFEGRVMLDGSTLVAGDYSEEGESTTEERTLFCWGVLEGLSAASHTITFQSRDDTATAANNHRESSLLIFRASQFPDLFYHLNSNTTINSGADTQIATVTDTLSEDQNALIIGGGNMDQNEATGGWIWATDGGTVVTPVTSQASGTTTANWVANDNTDELNACYIGYRALTSGTLNIDLLANQGDGSGGDHPMIAPRLLVWGLELGAGAGITGTVAVTQGAYTAAASGTVTPPPITGTVAVTLASYVSAVAGQLGVSGSAAPTLDPFTSAVSGLAGIQGSVAVTLEDFISVASGAVSEPGITGSVAVTLEDYLAAAAGQLGYSGTVAVTLDDFTSDIAGTHVPPGISGSVAVILGEYIAAASGQLGATGAVAVILDDYVMAAAGMVVNPITGTVAVTLGVFVASATGVTYSIPSEGGQVGGGIGPADVAGQQGAASTVGAIRSARVAPAPGIPGIGGGAGIPEVRK